MNSGAFSTNVASGGMPSELASSASSIGTSYERWDWSRSRFRRGRIDRDTVVPSMRSAPPDAATTWKMSGSDSVATSSRSPASSPTSARAACNVAA